MRLKLFNPIHFYGSNYRMILYILIAVFLIVLTAILAPFLQSKGMTEIFKFVNFFDSLLCHQHSTRCYNLFGHNIGLCARCFSFYITILIFVLIGSFINIKLKEKIKYLLFIIFTTPLIVDGLTQYLNFRESTNLVRTITGVMGGLGASIMILKIFYNSSIPFYQNIKRYRRTAC